MARHHEEDKGLGPVGALAELLYVAHDVQGAALVDQACVQRWQHAGEQQEPRCGFLPRFQAFQGIS